VRQNHHIALTRLGRSPAQMQDVAQVHGARVVEVAGPPDPDRPRPEGDALLTTHPDVTLFMRFADCVPILLYDPEHQAVGLVHAGWRGTVKRVAAAAVGHMHTRFQTRPQALLAAIGPSICARHYQVGPEVAAQVVQAFGVDACVLLPDPSGGVQFDLWAANRLVLHQAGVQQVETAAVCTACHLDDWFSHRAEHGRTGRFGAMIGVPG